MKPVVQQDRTGCGIASVAALTVQTYAAVKKTAAQLGIAVNNPKLWSETMPVRRLLAHFRIATKGEEKFVSWDALPDCALLAIKWHREKAGVAWHWVVFVRDSSDRYVLDPKKALRTHRRTDFGRMHPKWFIRLQPKATSRSRE